MTDTLTYFHEGKSFRTEGQLPKDTKYVRIIIGDLEKWAKPAMKIAKAIKLIEDAFRTGQVRAPWYRLEATAAPAGMSEETKAKLRQINEDKKRVATEADSE